MHQLVNPKMYACELIYIVQNVFLTVIKEFFADKAYYDFNVP